MLISTHLNVILVVFVLFTHYYLRRRRRLGDLPIYIYMDWHMAFRASSVDMHLIFNVVFLCISVNLTQCSGKYIAVVDIITFSLKLGCMGSNSENFL